MKTGLLFGSFNPIHLGHLIVAQHILNGGYCNECWLVVSPQNPFKNTIGLADANHRLSMARLAIAGNNQIFVSDEEFHLSLPSYTIHSLDSLVVKHPDREFVLIVGDDLLPTFHQWKDYQSILNRFNILVYPRGANTTETATMTGHRWFRVDAPKIEISSTHIRMLFQSGKSPRYLLPDAVLEYIRKHGLYT